MSLYTRLEGDMAAQAVLAALGRGRERARSLGELAEDDLRWTRRMVEKAVQALRLDGFPVCADGSGVWLGDRADLDRTIASLQRRLAAQYTTLRALRRARERMLPVTQTTLFGDAA